jgi:outer membrane protein assembly factor BamB
MNQDFVTQLRLQLREAAVRDERRTPAARRLVDARVRAPRPAALAAGTAVALLALAAALGALSLRGEPEPTTPKIIHTFTIASGLTSIAHGFGAVWAADLSSGNVVRVDQKTRKVVARVPVAGNTANGPSPDVFVAAGAGAVWALASGHQLDGRERPRLLRIDPRLNRAVASIPIRTPSGGNFNPVAVQIAGGAVWVIGTAGALEVDPATGSPLHYVPAAHAELGVVAEGDTLWLLGLNGRLRQVDARTGRTVHTVRVPVTTDTHLGPASPGMLKRIGDGRITAFDPTDGRSLWHATLDAPLNYLAPGSRDSLWLYAISTPELRDRLVRLDAGTGRRTAQVEVPDPGTVGLVRVGRELGIGHPNGRITVVR